MKEKKQLTYRVITSEAIGELENEINEFKNNGWRTSGGIIQYDENIKMGESGFTTEKRFAQAINRKSKMISFSRDNIKQIIPADKLKKITYIYETDSREEIRMIELIDARGIVWEIQEVDGMIKFFEAVNSTHTDEYERLIMRVDKNNKKEK